MKHLTDTEKASIKARIKKALDKVMEKETYDYDHNLGYLGETTVEHMADAAASVLFAIQELNLYMGKQGIMKEEYQ